MIRAALLAIAAVAATPFPVLADGVPGPLTAEVTRVIDGDTIAVRAEIWLDLAVTSLVRIRGIDTPELRGACSEEAAMAVTARARLAALAGDAVRLRNVTRDKYGGRVVADVAATDGTDLAAAMIAAGLARPYEGGSRGDWCFTASVAAGK